MSDDLDLSGIDQRHEPDPHFRAALRDRLVAIMDGTAPARAISAPVEPTTVTVQSTAREQASGRRRWTARWMIALAGAAAIVAAIVVVSSPDDTLTPAPGGGTEVVPTTANAAASAEPSAPETVASPVTPAPSTLPTPPPEPDVLAPGMYTLAKPEGLPSDYERLIFTLPAGWAISDGVVHKRLDQVDEVAFSTWVVDRVYDDPCNWQESPLSELDLSDDQVHKNFHEVSTGSTVGKPLHGGLANQLWRSASDLTHVELGGESALKIELSVPAELDLATCDQGQFRSWTGLGATGRADAHHKPGQTDVVYMVDVDRRPLVIDASHMPDTSAGDLAELEAILASMIVDRGP